MPENRPHLLVICTGNAARSVMAGALLNLRGVDAQVTTAGTHVVEHQPMSIRTREALKSIGVEGLAHRSRQVAEADIDSADLVIAMAADHVRWVRRRHAAAAARTATLCWLAQKLEGGSAPFDERVAALHLEDLDPDSQGDVPDPAGGDYSEYVTCARQIEYLVDDLVTRLG